MSMTLTALVAPEARAARSRTCGLAVRRWRAACINWRIERAAIAQLGTMSDRMLKDLGLTRSAIARIVRGEPAREARLQALLLLSTPESILS